MIILLFALQQARAQDRSVIALYNSACVDQPTGSYAAGWKIEIALHIN